MRKLTGSEKQVNWAESLRTLFVEKLDVVLAEAKKDEIKNFAEFESYIKSAIDSIEESEWWIDRFKNMPSALEKSSRDYYLGKGIQSTLNQLLYLEKPEDYNLFFTWRDLPEMLGETAERLAAEGKI